MKFTKMEGLGNDYVYINGFEETVEEPSKLARKISDRHFGIGSDGLILIKPSDKVDFAMDMYNADGSRSEMCGNGIRCVGKYVYDFGLTDKRNLTIETLAGIKDLTLHVDENTEKGKVKEVTVNMGKPIIEHRDFPLIVDGKTFSVTCVSMGNPHCITFVKDVSKVPLEQFGSKIEHHPTFPNRTNVEFVQVLDRNRLKIRVWERGTGETLACGTGACAAAVAGILNLKMESELAVELLGGTLKVRWDRKKDAVYMTGAARTVFCGEMDDLEIF